MCEDKKFVSIDSADKNFELEPQSWCHHGATKPEKRAPCSAAVLRGMWCLERPLRLDLDKPEEPENQAQFALSLYQGDIVCESDAGMMNLCTAFSNSSRRSRSYLMRRDPYWELCCSGWKSSHRRGANTDAEVHQRCVEGEGVVRSNTVLFGCDILLHCFSCIVLSCLLGQTGAHRCKK